MGVLEVTLLRLKPDIAPTDPSLLSNLQTIRSQLGTNSRFYLCIEDPSLLYLFGLWPTIKAHHDFLASPESAIILQPQEHQTEFLWGIHMLLDSMDALPLDAPVLFISRAFVKPDQWKQLEPLFIEQSKIEKKASTPYPIAQGLRVDNEKGGMEYISITGWESVDAHKKFADETVRVLDKAMGDTLLDKEERHLRDLEKMSRDGFN